MEENKEAENVPESEEKPQDDTNTEVGEENASSDDLEGKNEGSGEEPEAEKEKETE